MNIYQKGWRLISSMEIERKKMTLSDWLILAFLLTLILASATQIA